MAETKYFDPRVLASITSGTLMIDDFGAAHAAIEFIVGHQVWTHEIPQMSRAITPEIVTQYPDMPTTHPEDWRACADGLLAKYGAAIPMVSGNRQRGASPLDTLNEALRRPAGAGGAND
ncbi:hypothetical protein [Azorhizobium doebereinerae]|uniref:DUF7736 domain-containing protein n=1 Tax=Azorhizobium doebereinerae TaxID=281091 RepID=UPI000553DCC8|nr:hypothetical protein [Azorhizobium doebereinerae]